MNDERSRWFVHLFESSPIFVRLKFIQTKRVVHLRGVGKVGKKWHCATKK